MTRRRATLAHVEMEVHWTRAQMYYAMAEGLACVATGDPASARICFAESARLALFSLKLGIAAALLRGGASGPNLQGERITLNWEGHDEERDATRGETAGRGPEDAAHGPGQDPAGGD